MAMGKQKKHDQQPLFIPTVKLPQSAAHPFYAKLNEVLAGWKFDELVEGLCAKFYQEKMGRPSLAPGKYFRLLLIGYFEGIDSERGIAWRCSDSLSLRAFVGYRLDEISTEHSTISRTRRLIDLETHREVFQWVLKVLADYDLISGKPIIVEGVRDAEGNIPVITGNDAAPANAWKPVEGYQGVYRADLFTKLLGPVSVDGKTLHEVSWLDDLRPGTDLINFGSTEMLHPKSEADLAKLDWHRMQGTSVNLGPPGKPAVYYASTWVWVDAPPDMPPPKDGKPRIVDQLAGSGGTSRFRMYRVTALGPSQQNRMRGWVNGVALPSAYVSGQPRASHDPGIEHWQDFTFHEGWNHLVFLLDTTQLPNEVAWNFHWLGKMISSADKPADLTARPAGAPNINATEWNIAGPFPATPDNGVYVRLQGDADPNANVVDMAARDSVVQIQTAFLHLRGFEIRDGATYFQNAQLGINCAQGVLVEGCRFIGAENKSIIVSPAFENQLSVPNVLRGNWVESPGNSGISIPDNAEPPPGTKADLYADENTTVNGRMRVVSEYNRVTDNNASGYSRWDESGGFKSLLSCGCLYRGNEIIGGDGPGMWFDWENFNDRVEGNLFLHPIGFAVGFEASPGPNLIANNLIVDNQHGGGFFAAAICAWSSNATIAVNNTMDGRWAPSPDQGMFGSGVSNFMLHEGPNNRGTAWGELPKRDRMMVDNLSLGYPPLHNIYGSSLTDTVNYMLANYTDISETSIAMDGGVQTPTNSPVRDYRALDYELKPGHPLGRAGGTDKYTAMVTHDFYGLPRFPEDGRSVGAFRVQPIPQDASQPMIEIEKTDGTFTRTNEQIPPVDLQHPILADAIALSIPPIEKLHFYRDLASVGGHPDASAAVPVEWSEAALKVNADYDNFDRLIQRGVWQIGDATHVDDPSGGYYEFSNGARMKNDEWGMSMGGRAGLVCTATKAFKALVYVHPISIDAWGGSPNGRLFLVRWHGDEAPKALWRDDRVGNYSPAAAFCQSVDLKPGDHLGVAGDLKSNGSFTVDFRVGLLPGKGS